MGRPKKPDQSRRSELLVIRLTVGEKELLDAAAAAVDQASTAVWARGVIVRAASRRARDNAGDEQSDES